jgi:hypothetical protein
MKFSKIGAAAEKRVAKLTASKQTPSSGAKWFAKGDIKNASHLMEVKSTTKKSYRFNLETWQKIEREALAQDRQAILYVEFSSRGKKHLFSITRYSEEMDGKIIKKCSECFQEKSAEEFIRPWWAHECPFECNDCFYLRVKERGEAYRKKLRAEFLSAYGDKCECCDESESKFLTLEHKNNDGNEHRKTVGLASHAMYNHLKKRGWPKDGFGILCWNCNCAKNIYGVCPHELARRKNNT